MFLSLVMVHLNIYIQDWSIPQFQGIQEELVEELVEEFVDFRLGNSFWATAIFSIVRNFFLSFLMTPVNLIPLFFASRKQRQNHIGIWYSTSSIFIFMIHFVKIFIVFFVMAYQRLKMVIVASQCSRGPKVSFKI